jgi:carbohydrate kinase (thermoresistant glucokinase family)
MGVSGSGKSAIGQALARELGVPFVDGDDLYQAADVAKMAAGHPLTEADRRPWLATVRAALAASPAVVVACSALSRAARAELRGAGGVTFVDLVVDERTARHRVAGRRGHFMKAGMVRSQFAALEPPGPDETDVVAVDAGAPEGVVLARVGAALGLVTGR